MTKLDTLESYEENMVDRTHYCGGYREYWKNVKGCTENVGDIEIHFVDSANEILKKAFTSKIIAYKPSKDKIGIPEKSLNPKENSLRH